MVVFASCLDKIEELYFDAYIHSHGWEILSTAINKLPTPVSLRKLNCVIEYVFIQLLKIIELYFV